jgi:hypothetical protein
MTSQQARQTLEVNPASQASEKSYRPAPVRRSEHLESGFTRLIENQTAKVPSHVFLVLGLGAMGVSLGCELAGRTRASRFIGLWPQSLLVLGVYNKLVKTFGTI